MSKFRHFLRGLAGFTGSVLIVGSSPSVTDAQTVVRDWQKIIVPSVRDAARKFANPPAEYSLTMWWFWNGEMTDANIRRDLADLKAQGVHSVMLWCYNGLTNLEYLSPAWFERVKFAVQEARRVGVRVWIADEGCYPSGFIGGKVTRERPAQRMQILTAQKTSAGQIEVKPEYRTPATRYIHTPGFRKDETCSLFDALNPVATGDFLKDVHEQYRQHIGDEFGRTVLGFMGDEPSFPGVPYTVGIFEEFERRKGYDVRPHLPRLFTKEPREEDRRIRADYWDVWSDLYRDNFFKPQADWCARHGLEFEMHICGEEDMKTLVALNGDYFKCMRPVQVPGVDAIWRQIWPDKIADYAKLASSVAHVWGRPRAFSEGYAVYGRGLSVEQAKWVLDHHFARGINLFQTMSYLSSRETFRPYFCPPDLNLSPQWPQFSQLFAYANRMSYLLSVGQPTAAIAIYYPTTSGWLGDFSADAATLLIAQRLLERQRDFDFVDEQALQSGLKLESATLVNQSGQRYRTVIVPPVKVISETALALLEAFARAGGKVVFVKQWPELVAGKTYLHAAKSPTHSPWATLVTENELLDRAPDLLPTPDLKLEQRPAGAACPAVKHVHRRLADGEVYFLFNESDRALDLTALLQGAGAPEYWDAITGKRARAAAWSHQGDGVRLSLTLEPYEGRTIVLGPATSRVAEVRPALKQTSDSIPIEGDWKLTIAGKEFCGPLKTWAEYGEPGFCGTVRYTKEFNVPRSFADARRELHLDLGEVKYSARVRLNGKDLGALAWRPFRWPVGDAIREGVNILEIEITNTAANELAGNPARFAELEKKGWLQNSYVKRYLPFDKEMVPSGLLGPVRVVRYEICNCEETGK
ncbi:MAG: glycosyl hydrolase [Verrucomicrobia bacterium]|nr:glycosyl hydrolase [Verrucomicrobiota bacterium]